MHIESWSEFRYWHILRPSERLLVWTAHHLPRKLKERVYIDMAVEGLSNMSPDTVVPEVRMVEIMDAWNR